MPGLRVVMRVLAPREVSEPAPAQVNNKRTEAAYQRTDLFERRRTLMQQWADYLVAACPPGHSLPGESRLIAQWRSRASRSIRAV